MNPFINGELDLLAKGRTQAANAVEAYDAALAILRRVAGVEKVEPKFGKAEAVGNFVKKTLEARRATAVREYLDGASTTELGRKYKVSHVTIRSWVLAAGEQMRTGKQAQRLRAAKGAR